MIHTVARSRFLPGIFRSTLFCVVLAFPCVSACSLMTVNNAPATAVALPQFPSGTEILLLIEGVLCLETWGDECAQSTARDFYPVSLLEAQKGSEYAASRGELATLGLQYAVCESVLTTNCPANPRIRYDITNYQSWKDYRANKPKNVIEMRVRNPVSVSHWSIYLTYVTLGISPGYAIQTPQIEMVYFDAAGKEIQLKSGTAPQHKHWQSWIFIGWGDTYTALKGGPEGYEHHFRELFSQSQNSR